jgi:hypothetical protein
MPQTGRRRRGADQARHDAASRQAHDSTPNDAQALEVGRMVLRMAALLGLTGAAPAVFTQDTCPPDCPSRDAFLRRHRLRVKSKTPGWTIRGKTRSVTADAWALDVQSETARAGAPRLTLVEPTAPSAGAQRGELEIVAETTMAEMPRGRDGRECLRVRFVRARTPDGKDVAWHDVRLFWRADDGEFRPSSKGISIRGAELRAVADALQKAVSGGHSPTTAAAPVAETRRPEHRASTSAQPLLPHEQYARMRGRAP